MTKTIVENFDDLNDDFDAFGFDLKVLRTIFDIILLNIKSSPTNQGNWSRPGFVTAREVVKNLKLSF